MTSANDNRRRNRRARDGYVRRWQSSHLGEIATDEALVRLADARNSSSKSSNRFMMLATLSAFFYFLKLQGVAQDLEISDYKLDGIPFALFVFSSSALILSTVSLIRNGDSRAYDRQLRLACELKHGSDCESRYIVFPNENAWGQPFSLLASVIDSGIVASIFRFISLGLINIFLVFMIISPLIIGLDYAFCGRVGMEPEFQSARHYLISFLCIANFSTLLLTLWARFADRN